VGVTTEKIKSGFFFFEKKPIAGGRKRGKRKGKKKEGEAGRVEKGGTISYQSQEAKKQL